MHGTVFMDGRDHRPAMTNLAKGARGAAETRKTLATEFTAHSRAILPHRLDVSL
jgi:hypothetical protein